MLVAVIVAVALFTFFMVFGSALGFAGGDVREGLVCGLIAWVVVVLAAVIVIVTGVLIKAVAG